MSLNKHRPGYSREYYLKNRGILIQKSRLWRANNREKHLQALKEYGIKHRFERTIYRAKWDKENPDKHKRNATVSRMNYKARKLNAAGSFTYDQWILKVEYHGWKCFYCKKDLNYKTLSIDHRKPLSKGGANWISNLVPSCKSCNSIKKDQWKNSIEVHSDF